MVVTGGIYFYGVSLSEEILYKLFNKGVIKY
jgi:hypothetical protein